MRLLIDGDILRYRYGFAAQKKVSHTGSDGVVTDMQILMVEPEWKVIDALKWGIIRMMNNTKCREYTIYLSGPNNFRFKVDPEYKANRKDMEKPYHYNNITQYLVEVHEAETTDGYEADDALAMAQTEDTIIASIDKDLNQIPGWHYDIVKENLYYVDERDAEISFLKQLLTGDRTDNVSGIRGIGPVKADKLADGQSSSDEFADLCYRMYRDHFGEENGPVMFDKNWNLLRLLRSKEELCEIQKKLETSGDALLIQKP